MEPEAERLARILHDIVIEEYHDWMVNLRNSQDEKITDQFYRNAADLVRNADEQQFQLIERFGRMAAMNSVASILGHVDGSAWSEGIDKEFTLTYGETDVTEGIADGFLLAEEESLQK